jgi:hypothetical protein
MKNLELSAKAKIEELQASLKPYSTEALNEEKGFAAVWNSTDVEGEFVTIFPEPVQASFTKKEKKEQVPYSGYAYGMKWLTIGTRKNGAPKYAQHVLGVFSKVGEEEAAEVEMKRTRVTSGDAEFPRTTTVSLLAKFVPAETAEQA